MSESLRATCPVCGKPVETDPQNVRPPFPFCSDRCRLIDLGRWLGERYRIPAQEEVGDQDTLELPPHSADPSTPAN
jgi:endogenous inhibitor of DNA gyrase (YacG/DUF329 family)